MLIDLIDYLNFATKIAQKSISVGMLSVNKGLICVICQKTNLILSAFKPYYSKKHPWQMKEACCSKQSSVYIKVIETVR